MWWAGRRPAVPSARAASVSSTRAFSPPERPRGFWDFAPLLPVTPGSAVTLGEGGTPLLPARLDGAYLLLKLECQNPTGSQKDRALALAVAHAKEQRAAGRYRVYR